MAKARGIVLFGLVPLLFVAGTGVVSVRYLDSAGNRFFNNGKEITGTLNDLGHALKARDYAAVGEFYAPQFQGSRLGFGTLKQVELKDGVHKDLFTSDGATEDRTAALAEWRAYLDSFDSIDELTLHIHQLDKWGSRDDLEASVRFELIGTPHGAKYAGIDRGYFRMAFKGNDKGLSVTSASLISGDRSIGDTPHFTDVSASAGIDFMNQYYPEFLNEKLRFGMIRYGPGGISAADYDNDGFYDLFIPDGVESRLLPQHAATARSRTSRRRPGSRGWTASASACSPTTTTTATRICSSAARSSPTSCSTTTATARSPMSRRSRGSATTAARPSPRGATTTTTAYLDLYVGRYLDPRTDIPTTFYARNGEPNQLYHNNGDGTFTNVTEKAGVGDIGPVPRHGLGRLRQRRLSRPLRRQRLRPQDALPQQPERHVHRRHGEQPARSTYGAGMSAVDGRLRQRRPARPLRRQHPLRATRGSPSAPTVGALHAELLAAGRVADRHAALLPDLPAVRLRVPRGLPADGVGQHAAAQPRRRHLRGRHRGERTPTRSGWFWGASFADFDNDGWQDIYSADGWVYNDTGTEIELDFLNSVVSEQKRLQDRDVLRPEVVRHAVVARLRAQPPAAQQRRRHVPRDRPGGGQRPAARTAAASRWPTSGTAGGWTSPCRRRPTGTRCCKNEVGRHAALARRGTGGHQIEPRRGRARASTSRVGAKRQMREVTAGDGYGSRELAAPALRPGRRATGRRARR